MALGAVERSDGGFMWDIDGLIALTPAVALAFAAGAVGAYVGDSAAAAYAALAGFLAGVPVSLCAHRRGGLWTKRVIAAMSIIALFAVVAWGYRTGALHRFLHPSLF